MLAVVLALVFWLLQRFDERPTHISQTTINYIIQQAGPDGAAQELRERRPRTGRSREQDRPLDNHPRPKTSGAHRSGARGWPNARCRCGSGLRRSECCHKAK
jgi:hypothetical protein